MLDVLVSFVVFGRLLHRDIFLGHSPLLAVLVAHVLYANVLFQVASVGKEGIAQRAPEEDSSINFKLRFKTGPRHNIFDNIYFVLSID